MSVEDNLKTISRYRSYAMWAGIFIGAVVGIMIGGDRFREWENPLSTRGTLIVACAAIEGAVGYSFCSLRGRSDGAEGGNGGDGGGGDYICCSWFPKHQM